MCNSTSAASARGSAAELVATELVAAGAAAAYVSVGGDVAAAGEPPEDGWLVPLLDPRMGGRSPTTHSCRVASR